MMLPAMLRRRWLALIALCGTVACGLNPLPGLPGGSDDDEGAGYVPSGPSRGESGAGGQAGDGGDGGDGHDEADASVGGHGGR